MNLIMIQIHSGWHRRDLKSNIESHYTLCFLTVFSSKALPTNKIIKLNFQIIYIQETLATESLFSPVLNVNRVIYKLSDFQKLTHGWAVAGGYSFYDEKYI